MPFAPEVKMLLKFSDLTLTDEIGGYQMSLFGNSSVSLAPDGSGYIFKRDQFLYMEDVSLSSSTEMTIGFWSYPKHPGVAMNPSTNNVEPMKVSVLDISDGVVDPSTGLVDLSTQVFTIYEEAQLDGSVKIVAKLNNVYVAKSSSYDPDKWHHIWMAYNGSGPTFAIFVDGVQDTISQQGTVPSSLSASSVTICLNRLAIDPSFNTINNEGYVDDIVILNDYVISLDTIHRIVNSSVEYGLNTDFTNVVESSFPFLFSDPTSTKVTDVFNDGSYTYISDSNGTVFKASPLFWDVRKDFSNPEEVPSSDILSDGIKVTNGVLEISKGMIKI